MVVAQVTLMSPFPPPAEDAQVPPSPTVASPVSTAQPVFLLPAPWVGDGFGMGRNPCGVLMGPRNHSGVSCPAPALGQLEATGKGT